MHNAEKCKRYGMSLVEVLGATAVVMTVASVVVISAKDTLTASQRSAVQRELQSLNSALNNFKAAGGVYRPRILGRGCRSCHAGWGGGQRYGLPAAQ